MKVQGSRLGVTVDTFRGALRGEGVQAMPDSMVDTTHHVEC